MTPAKHVCAAHKDTLYCFAVTRDKNENTINSDLIGQDPERSYNSRVSIFIAYMYTVNMKNQEDACIVEAFANISADLEAIWHKPKLHVLDNEHPRAVHNFLKIKNTTRHNLKARHHSANRAELAIKSAKYHIISHVATMDAR